MRQRRVGSAFKHEFDGDPPGPTEVLVRVAAVGLCRTDYHVMRGLDPRILLKKFVVV